MCIYHTKCFIYITANYTELTFDRYELTTQKLLSYAVKASYVDAYYILPIRNP